MNTVTPLIVTYAITDDNFNGSPWMPDGANFWAIVARGHGRTKWRRLSLETPNKFRIENAPPGLASGSTSSGNRGPRS